MAARVGKTLESTLNPVKSNPRTKTRSRTAPWGTNTSGGMTAQRARSDSQPTGTWSLDIL